jgi:sarcosine oxidase subunit gamma
VPVVTADLSLASLRRSPLQGRAGELASASAPDRGIRLAELPFLGAVTVRVDPQGAPAARIGQALGVALPAAGAAVVAGTRAVLWQGPDEWLVVGPGGDSPRLCALLADAGGTAVDVSANRTTVEVSGPNARDLLAKACTLDLHPRSFTAGRCAQTTFARTHVILWQTSDEPSYRLMVRGSFADYLADWLLDAAEEYSVPLVSP